jgi:hypothetical protein
MPDSNSRSQHPASQPDVDRKIEWMHSQDQPAKEVHHGLNLKYNPGQFVSNQLKTGTLNNKSFITHGAASTPKSACPLMCT